MRNGTNATATAGCGASCLHDLFLGAACITVIALLANGYVLISALWLKKNLNENRLTYVWLCVSLAAADCLTSLLGLVCTLPNVSMHACLMIVVDRVRVGCLLTSILHLLIISAQQLFAIVSPMAQLKYSTPALCKLLIAMMWIVPSGILVLASSVSTKYGLRSLRCKDDLTGLLAYGLSISLCVWVPCCATVACYGIILYKIHQRAFQPTPVILSSSQRSRSRSSVQPSPSKSSSTGSPARHASANQTASQNRRSDTSATQRGYANAAPPTQRTSSVSTSLRRHSVCSVRTAVSIVSRNREERRVLETTLLITASFVIGWMPNSISLFVFSLVSQEYYLRNLWFIIPVSFSTYTLTVLKSLLNAVIYALRISELQHAMRQMHQQCRAYVTIAGRRMSKPTLQTSLRASSSSRRASDKSSCNNNYTTL